MSLPSAAASDGQSRRDESVPARYCWGPTLLPRIRKTKFPLSACREGQFRALHSSQDAHLLAAHTHLSHTDPPRKSVIKYTQTLWLHSRDWTCMISQAHSEPEFRGLNGSKLQSMDQYRVCWGQLRGPHAQPDFCLPCISLLPSPCQEGPLQSPSCCKALLPFPKSRSVLPRLTPSPSCWNLLPLHRAGSYPVRMALRKQHGLGGFTKRRMFLVVLENRSPRRRWRGVPPWWGLSSWLGDGRGLVSAPCRARPHPFPLLTGTPVLPERSHHLTSPQSPSKGPTSTHNHTGASGLQAMNPGGGGEGGHQHRAHSSQHQEERADFRLTA